MEDFLKDNSDLINNNDENDENNIENNLHISTDEIYGSTVNKYFVENDKMNPSSPYSASKASAEMICMSYIKTYGMNINILRPANNYGIYQQPEKLIPFSILNLLNGKENSFEASINSKILFIKVDESIVIFFPIFHLGCFIASRG